MYRSALRIEEVQSSEMRWFDKLLCVSQILIACRRKWHFDFGTFFETDQEAASRLRRWWAASLEKLINMRQKTVDFCDRDLYTARTFQDTS